MSQSRQGQARSAAILLYTCHLDALRLLSDQTSHSSSNSQNLLYQKSKSYSHEIIMMKHIEQQIEEQKRLLLYDLPELRNHNTLMRKLNLMPRSEFDLTQFDRHYYDESRSMHKKLHRRFFTRFLRTKTEDDDNQINSLGCGESHSGGRSGCGGASGDDDDNMDERSVSGDEMSMNKSADMIDVVDTSPARHFHIGYSNPLACDDFEDIDADGDDDEANDNESLNSHEEFHRYIIDDEVVIIGAMPTPTTSSGPSIVVKSSLSLSLTHTQLRLMCRKKSI